MKLVYFITFAFIITNCNCKAQQNIYLVAKDSNESFSPEDTFRVKESENEEDFVENEYLIKDLEPIRKNFKRLNSIAKWDSVIVKDIWLSIEGGEAKYYYSKKKLRKIIARYYGETYQNLSEYYLLNNKLSFVFEKNYKYNRPLYYDSLVMKENGDNEVWDLGKSEITETRSYFKNGKLIHQISSQDCGAPFAAEYLLEEQKTIKEEFKELLSALIKKEEDN
ncbi:hypothetical protein [Ferruginibacter albus]|uniref:hypothetical protein n=1 Tax=Ferruginibacter albus TaxID=2875540 RepID=UPI001CC65507|nr:hypothetical protein [Ferruginibacter albus]UAY51986.1 hypothetical protein K9M53_15510 [Ferruginibacter albus]